MARAANATPPRPAGVRTARAGGAGVRELVTYILRGTWRWLIP